MFLFDVLIAALLVWPLFAEDVFVTLPGVGSMALQDLGLPAAAAAFIAVLVHAGPLRFAAEVARATRPRHVAIGAAALAAAVVALQLWQRGNPGAGLDAVVWILTRGLGAVVLVLLFGIGARRWTREPWEKSQFVRLGIRIGQTWLRWVERAPALTLWTAAALVGAVYFWNAALRHWAFESHGHDLGIFTNAMWNLTHGNGYVSSIKDGMNLFADHQSPLFWLLAPLFWAVPRPETLLFVQAFGLAAGGPALYHLARQRFGEEHWVRAALPWLYWAYLPLRNANAFDFHPEVFMLPLFLWAFVGFGSPRRSARVLGLLALAGALGAKESAPVVATGIGIAWALTGARRWPGLALAAAGVALFFFDVKVVPRLFGDDYAYLGMYQRFGGSITDVLLAPLFQPAYFFSQILDAPRLNFLFWTLAPLGFLPLFNWRAALAALPPYLMLFLSEGEQRVRLVFHYGIEPGSALFWALPLGLAAFVERFGWRSAGLWMLVWALATHGLSELGRARSFFQYLHAPWLARVMPCLDERASVAATGSLVPHLATRAWISYPDVLRQVPSGAPVRCVVTDLKLSNWPVGREGTQRVLAELPGRGYREAWRCYDFRVFELQTQPGCLRCVPQCY
jgi:Predicted membrane protein (DUF2079)